MSKNEPQPNELREQLTDALSQVDALQSAVADAEARAATQAERVAALEAKVGAARDEGEAVGSRLRDSATRYREARLAAAPHIPAELVTAETFEEIDEQLEAAERVAAQLRESMEKQRRSSPSARPGAPVRRAPDYSQLPAGEKIKLGLQQMADRERG